MLVKTSLKEYSMKVCSKCNIEKELSEFNKSTLYADGKRCECRECQKILSSIYRKKNRDKINENARIQYHMIPEIQRNRDLRWKEKNLS